MISYYELLGLIKDGNPPKKVKFNESVFEWNGSCYFNEDDDYSERFLSKIFVEFSMLNERCIKIVEEPIEKLKIKGEDICYGLMKEWLDFTPNDNEQKICSAIEMIGVKINEIIDKVNEKVKE